MILAQVENQPIAPLHFVPNRDRFNLDCHAWNGIVQM
jgi:hypothetical protein